MKIKRLGLKVSFIVTLMVVLIVGLAIWMVSVQTNRLVDEISARYAESANTSLKTTIEELRNDAYVRAMMIGDSLNVIKAMAEDDTFTLRSSISNLKAGLDDVSLYDKTGRFIVSTSPDIKAESFNNQDDILRILSTGSSTSTIKIGINGRLYTYGSAAITASDGNIIGAVVCTHDLLLPKYVDKVKELSNCEVSIFVGGTCMSTTLNYENGESAAGFKADDKIIEKVIGQKDVYETQEGLFGKTYHSIYSPLIIDDKAISILYSGVSIDSVIAYQRTMIASIILVIAICGTACIILIITFSTSAISRPLRRISLFAEKIRLGDLGISSNNEMVIGVHSNDEIGVMAKTLESAFAELRGYIEEIDTRMRGLAEGDLVTKSDYEFRGDFVLIKDSINGIISVLNETMKKYKIAAAQVFESSAQMAESAKTIADGALVQAFTVDELSATIGGIMKDTLQNAVVAKEATNLYGGIRSAAVAGSRQMEKMMLAIGEINESSSQIKKAIKVIDDISLQTNVLAVNAAVEAAKAGVHGKNFAVVAEEVRELANKSTVAANYISRLIANSVEKANLGLNIANDTSTSLNNIVHGIGRSAEIITQVANSINGQAETMKQLNTGIDQVAQIIQQNSTSAEENAAMSEEINAQYLVLQEMSQHFKVENGDD